MHSKTCYVYILTNKINTTFYVGVTNDLQRRMYEHKQKLVEGFSKRYNLQKLVYYEETNLMIEAITREKQLKRWHRQWKINQIKTMNPDLKDLAEDWYEKT